MANKILYKIGKYIIDEETMKYCKALEFYDEHYYLPWNKKNKDKKLRAKYTLK